jgi:hypothetical protein
VSENGNAGRARVAGHECRSDQRRLCDRRRYLYRTGATSDNFATNEQLLSIIVQLFERGEFNKIRLANKAIARFEALVEWV